MRGAALLAALAVASPAAAQEPCPPEHAAMGHCTPAPPAAPKPEAPRPRGDDAAPIPPEPTYADRVWGQAAMAPSRAHLRREHGGGTFTQVMVDLAEYTVHDGRDGFRWDGEGWYGGDVDRLAVRSEGSGRFGDGVDAEVQALYSRAVVPYFNLQAGLRQDIGPGRSPTYAAIGVESLAPYWFEVEGTLFLSDRGDVSGRIEGYYDQRVTQRLVLQPRAELEWSAQRVAAQGIGAGPTDVELGLRLRYEIAREFAPYVGLSWERKLGATGSFARAAGEDRATGGLVIGVRAWF